MSIHCQLTYIPNLTPYYIYKITTLQTLEMYIKEVHNEVVQLRRQMAILNERVNSLEGRCEREVFFQRYLENKFGATHTKNSHGVTDIETDDKIIEIKNWRCYKSALGQVLSYSSISSKQKIVYFFGKKPKNIQMIVDLFKKYNIDVLHIYQDKDGQVIEEDIVDNIFFDPFIKWLHDNVVYEKDSLLKLSELIHLYEGKELTSHFSTVYKQKVEQFISSNFKQLNPNYGTVKICGKTYKGWRHLALNS